KAYEEKPRPNAPRNALALRGTHGRIRERKEQPGASVCTTRPVLLFYFAERVKNCTHIPSCSEIAVGVFTACGMLPFAPRGVVIFAVPAIFKLGCEYPGNELYKTTIVCGPMIPSGVRRFVF